jgi:hypothetical protein
MYRLSELPPSFPPRNSRIECRTYIRQVTFVRQIKDRGRFIYRARRQYITVSRERGRERESDSLALIIPSLHPRPPF